MTLLALLRRPDAEARIGRSLSRTGAALFA
jgi:hypothetical protein